MSRLTIRYYPTNEAEIYGSASIKEILEKLAHYEDLEEQGRLIVTKYAKGQTVYEVDDETSEIHEYKVGGNDVWHDVESDDCDVWNRLNSFREIGRAHV